MRKVKYRLNKSNCNGEIPFNLDGEFHQWAADCTETNEGFGNYTIALVEIEDGTILEILPCNIKFIKE